MIELTHDQNQQLMQNVNQVKMFLKKHGVQKPFFIAGGSVYGILNDVEYNDIDVYFYNKKDRNYAKAATEKLSDFVTDNSLNFNVTGCENVVEISVDDDMFNEVKEKKPLHDWEGPHKLQLIMKHFMSIEKTLDSFDFNCSRCAYTSDYKLELDSTYSNVITFNSASMSATILKRYHKYKDDKKAQDENSKTLYQIYEAIIDDLDAEFPQFYGGSDGVMGRTMLNGEMKGLQRVNNLTEIQYLHDRIIDKYEHDDLVRHMSMMSGLIYSEIPNPSIELKLVRVTKYMDVAPLTPDAETEFFSIADVKEVKGIYPEYFI